MHIKKFRPLGLWFRSGVWLWDLHFNKLAGDSDVGPLACTLRHTAQPLCFIAWKYILCLNSHWNPTRLASTLAMSTNTHCHDFTEELNHFAPFHNPDPDPMQTEPKPGVSLWRLLWERKVCWQRAGVLSYKLEWIPLETENKLRDFFTTKSFLKECSEVLIRVSNKGEATYSL